VDGLDRAAVVRRLVALDGAGRLGVEEVELAAGALGVSSRTVWRWVRQARAGEGLDCRPRGRFVVTDEVRQRLAFWRGNAAAVHRELVEAARNGGPAAPSLSTLQRAVARDVLAGDRAGCIQTIADIRVEHPVHPPAFDPDRERIQRVMRAAPRPKPVGELR
jgi:putative transposase